MMTLTLQTIFAYLSIFVNSPWIRICTGTNRNYLRLVFVHPLVQRSFLVTVSAQEQVGGDSANHKCDGVSQYHFHIFTLSVLVFTMQEKGVRLIAKKQKLSAPPYACWCNQQRREGDAMPTNRFSPNFLSPKAAGDW